jgi:hypothetical protein
MREYIELGQAPYEEDCSQVGTPDYHINARRECQSYIMAIRNYLGQEPDGAELRVKSFWHDFNQYMEVVCYYDESKPDSVDYAFMCEAKAPATWSDGGVKPPRMESSSKRSR